MSQPQILKVEEALNLLVGQARSKVLPRVVTISGGTCSGKTTFADRLAFRIRQAGLTAVIIPFDAYFRDFDDPMLLNTDGKRIFDVPKAYWVSEFAINIVTLIKKGLPVQIPVYDIRTNKRQPQRQTVQPADVIIAEGLFAGSSLRFLYEDAMRIYMETPEEKCMERRVNRDSSLYSVSPERVAASFIEKIHPYWHIHQQNEKTIAHIIVDDNKEGG